MAGVLAGLLGITLGELGKQVGLSVVGASVTKVFNLVAEAASGDPLAEVKTKLDEISKDVKKVGDAVAAVEQSIADMQLGIKMDLVQQFVTSVNTLYDQYMAALMAFAEAGTKLPASDKKQELDRERARLIELGNQVSNNTYKDLEQLHTFIAAQGTGSLLWLANAQSLRDSKDFMVHFVKMKTLLIMFYLIQQKGLQLFEYVVADPMVNFTDGPRLIANVSKNIVEQESFWTKALTPQVIRLASIIAQNPFSNLDVDFTGDKRKQIHSGNQWTPCLFLSPERERKPWSLEPVNKIDLLNLDVENTWVLREKRTNNVMETTGSQYRVVQGPQSLFEGMPRGCRWVLQSTETGHFRLKFRSDFVGKVYDYWVLKVIPEYNSISRLTAEANVPASDLTSLFEIQLWS